MAKVVVMGKNYTSRLGMIRAAGKAGHEVFVICTDKFFDDGLDKTSRYVSDFLTARAPDRKLLIKTLRKLGEQEDGDIVLLPTDDYSASAIDENIDQLKDRFLLPNVNMQAGAINQLMDKDFQKNLAIKVGLNVAKGWTIEIEGGKYTLPEGIVYPCFTKPQISMMLNKRCMRKCVNEHELKQVLDEVAAVKDCPILVEQYVEIEKEYAALGFCDGRHVLIPAVIHLKEQGHGAHRGVTKIGQLLPSSKYKKFFDPFEDFMIRTKFVGLFDVDMYESGGVMYFNELNLRFGASGYAITHQGINLPDMMIQALMGNQWYDDSVKDKEISGVFVNEKVNLEDYLTGFCGLRRMFEIHKQGDFSFIKDDDDPQPYNIFKKRAQVSVTKQIIKNIIGYHR